MKTAKLRDTVTGCEFTIYMADDETIEQRLADPRITNKCELIEAEPVFVGKDSNIVIEAEVQPDAVSEKQIALIEAALAEMAEAPINRRAVVKSISLGGTVRVSVQRWQRIIPDAHIDARHDTYKWVEIYSFRA